METSVEVLEGDVYRPVETRGGEIVGGAHVQHKGRIVRAGPLAKASRLDVGVGIARRREHLGDVQRRRLGGAGRVGVRRAHLVARRRVKRGVRERGKTAARYALPPLSHRTTRAAR